MHRPRRRIAIPLTVVLVGATAAGTYLLLHRDHATALTTAAALGKFRAAHPAPQASPQHKRTAPDPGVYTYATTGYEKTDVLGGARHNYPAVSTVTYSAAGCGQDDRWQPLTSRFGANLTCRTAAGLELRSTEQHREFFGRVQAQSFNCPTGFVEIPTPATPGRLSTVTCPGKSGSVALTSRVVGPAVRIVGGTAVEAVHLLITGTLTGQTAGDISRDLWLAADTGLLLEVTGTADTHSSTLAGPAKYTERYTLTLTSLAPQH
jgi:hypothetical protein